MIAELGLLVSAYVFVRMIDIGITHSHRPTKQMWLLGIALAFTALLSLLIGFGSLLNILDGATTP